MHHARYRIEWRSDPQQSIGGQTLSTPISLSGVQADEASDGEQGLRMALALQPDVAVIDIGLIAMTRYGQVEDRHRIALGELLG